MKNLILAFKKARKRKTKLSYVKKFEERLIENLRELQKELVNQTYKPFKLKEIIIREPKIRKICKSIFKDRIVHHALINIIGEIFEKTFIYDSFASQKGKGQHKALERFEFFKRKISNNGKRLQGIKDNNYVQGYCFKADIEKYFDNVNHNLLIQIIEEKIKDREIIWLIKQILKNYSCSKGKGMPLGNYTSQFFANIYLNKLDYFVKHQLRCKYYIRYVDDFVILHKTKEQLQKWEDKIDLFLKKELRIKLHKNKSQVVSLHKGIKFLGFRIFYYYRILRKSNINHLRNQLQDWKLLYDENLISYKKIIERLEGWFVHAKHGNTHNLRKKILKEFNENHLTKPQIQV